MISFDYLLVFKSGATSTSQVGLDGRGVFVRILAATNPHPTAGFVHVIGCKGVRYDGYIVGARPGHPLIGLYAGIDG